MLLVLLTANLDQKDGPTVPIMNHTRCRCVSAQLGHGHIGGDCLEGGDGEVADRSIIGGVIRCINHVNLKWGLAMGPLNTFFSCLPFLNNNLCGAH